MKQTEAVDFNNTENQNTSKEKMDMSDKMIDLSSYDFTDNYVESRLQDVSDDGAIYMLPSAYSCAWRRLHIRVMDFNICAILRTRDFWELFRASSGKRI